MKNKILLKIIIIAVLISTLVPLSIFADNISYIVPTGSSPITYNSPEQQYNTFFWYGVGNDGNGTYGQYAVTGGNYDGDLYAFMYTSGTNTFKLVFVIDGDIVSGDQIDFQCSTYYNSGAGYNIRRDSYSTYNAVLNVRYKELSTSFSGVPYINVFSTRDEGLNSIRTAIDNGTIGGVVPRYASITIQPVYIAYIGVSGGTAHLEITMAQKFSSATLSTQAYWYADSLPSGVFTVDPSNVSSHPIIWNAVGPFDFGRRTYNGDFDISGLSTNYLVIYNPLLALGTTNSNQPIRAEISSAVSVVQYPLTSNGSMINHESYGNTDNVYVADNDAISNDGSVEYTHYDVDGEGNTITSSAINLPAGGNNTIDEDSEGTITGFVNSILNLLSAPIKHIQRLFDSGSAFMQWLGELWSWLPEPVYTVLISALVVLVVIGVIKFLWK